MTNDNILMIYLLLLQFKYEAVELEQQAAALGIPKGDCHCPKHVWLDDQLNNIETELTERGIDLAVRSYDDIKNISGEMRQALKDIEQAQKATLTELAGQALSATFSKKIDDDPSNWN
jgi:deoxyribodipyrimidine photolyase